MILSLLPSTAAKGGDRDELQHFKQEVLGGGMSCCTCIVTAAVHSYIVDTTKVVEHRYFLANPACRGQSMGGVSRIQGGQYWGQVSHAVGSLLEEDCTEMNLRRAEFASMRC